MAATSGRSDLAIDDTSESGRADLTLDADTVDPTAPPAMVLCAFEGADADAATCSSSPAPGMLHRATCAWNEASFSECIKLALEAASTRLESSRCDSESESR